MHLSFVFLSMFALHMFHHCNGFIRTSRGHFQFRMRHKATASTLGLLSTKIDVERVQDQVRQDLKVWRKGVAETNKKPLYLVMHNKVIDAIAEQLPTTAHILSTIPGVGKKTLSYADTLIALVKNRFPEGEERYEFEQNANRLFSSKPPLPVVKKRTKKKVEMLPIREQSEDLDALYSSMMTASQFTDDQRAIAETILSSSKNYFISGSAGTGKSFLLKYIIQEMRRRYNLNGVAVTAPTGVAAIHVGGSTIHSFAGVGIGTVQ